LTNALEEYHPETGTLFAQFLANESREANAVKRDTPVMVVMGNPPYHGESANRGKWITKLMEDYKLEPGAEARLAERNSKWINDDYVKFIRMGQFFVEKNQIGILAYINSHSFLDNPTFRGMRWQLMRCFDKIYIIDLHGNAKKKEAAPDGGRDECVFDIQQGVSINIFVKTGRKPSAGLADVYHRDVYGARQGKHDFLMRETLSGIQFAKPSPSAPGYFFVPKNIAGRSEYENGISVTELFPIYGVGVTTAHDDFVIGDRDTLVKRFTEFKNAEPVPETLHKLFKVKKKLGWNILDGWKKLQDVDDVSSLVEPYSYRPFDSKCILYEDKLVWRCVRKIMQYFIEDYSYRPFDNRKIFYEDSLVCRPRRRVMQHFIGSENVGLVVGRQGQVVGPMPWSLVFIVKNITDLNMFYRGGGVIFPLYALPEPGEQGNAPRPNLNAEIVSEFSKRTGLGFETAPSGDANKYSPYDLLDYIYAVLHSPSYREKYKEFLKIDFPRVPYPTGAAEFRRLSALGKELRLLHLMESQALEKLITEYPAPGDGTIERPRWEPSESGGRVWINGAQYFDNVPQEAWNFCIGGYQPARKWLKDRRRLGPDEPCHYQKIIAALKKTSEIMKEIDGLQAGGRE
jgi:predicted helicase